MTIRTGDSEDDEDLGGETAKERSERVVAVINDVTIATGCAVSLRSARIWKSPRALILLAAGSKEDERFAVASATAKRDIIMRPKRFGSDKSLLMFVPVRVFPFWGSNYATITYSTQYNFLDATQALK